MSQKVEGNNPVIHTLKTWPEHFNAVKSGHKTFELRQNDRNFNVGDILLLQEFDPISQKYVVDTDDDIVNTVCVKVTHVLRGGRFGLSPEFDVLSIKPVG